MRTDFQVFKKFQILLLKDVPWRQYVDGEFYN